MRAVLHWLSKRPLWFLHALGRAAGWLAYGVSPAYRRTLRSNAGLAGLGRAQRRAAVGQSGCMALELPRLWLGVAAQNDMQGSPPWLWDNSELMTELLAQGRGLLVLTPHVGSFEVVAQAYAQRFGGQAPMTALYRPARQAWLRELEETARARPGLLTAPANLGGVRQLIRALRKGHAVGMLPDQVPPAGQGVWAPFFGRSAYTMTLVPRLVQQTGAAVVVVWGQRLAGGTGYRVLVRPMPVPLPTLPTGASEEEEQAWMLASVTVVNQAMEWVINQLPTQYLWGYNRYKQPRQVAPP